LLLGNDIPEKPATPILKAKNSILYRADCGNGVLPKRPYCPTQTWYLSPCKCQISSVLLLCVTPNSNSLHQCSLYNFIALHQLQACS